MRTVVLVDGRSFFQSVQTVEYLQGIFIGQFMITIVAESANGKVSLVQPDGATPVAARDLLGIVCGDGGEGDIRGELRGVLQHG